MALEHISKKVTTKDLVFCADAANVKCFDVNVNDTTPQDGSLLSMLFNIGTSNSGAIWENQIQYSQFNGSDLFQSHFDLTASVDKIDLTSIAQTSGIPIHPHTGGFTVGLLMQAVSNANSSAFNPLFVYESGTTDISFGRPGNISEIEIKESCVKEGSQLFETSAVNRDYIDYFTSNGAGGNWNAYMGICVEKGLSYNDCHDFIEEGLYSSQQSSNNHKISNTPEVLDLALDGIAVPTASSGLLGENNLQDTFTVPDGVTEITAVVVGGGGGAAGGQTGNSSSSSASGGGGGGLSYGTFSVTPGETLYIQAGAGGKGGTNRNYDDVYDIGLWIGPQDGTDGGDSYIKRTGHNATGGDVLLLAEGGKKGISWSTAASSGGAGGTGNLGYESDGGGNGGKGGQRYGYTASGGGGAGGYAGNGGDGGWGYSGQSVDRQGQAATSGSGGGGGGAVTYESSFNYMLIRQSDTTATSQNISLDRDMHSWPNSPLQNYTEYWKVVRIGNYDYTNAIWSSYADLADQDIFVEVAYNTTYDTDIKLTKAITISTGQDIMFIRASNFNGGGGVGIFDAERLRGVSIPVDDGSNDGYSSSTIRDNAPYSALSGSNNDGGGPGNNDDREGRSGKGGSGGTDGRPSYMYPICPRNLNTANPYHPSPVNTDGGGGIYGGGGGASNNDSNVIQTIHGGNGGRGCVRFVWGDSRTYTNHASVPEFVPSYFTKTITEDVWMYMAFGITSDGRPFASINGETKTLGNASTTWSNLSEFPLSSLLGDSNNNYNSKLAVAHVYDRELTEDELTQNYHVLKDRFGI